ncbi:hypothetical protein INR49_028813 [Caranx melampygus]|nr:hypothetical protein INR49_028813 [Caranx melampygus]
MYAPKYMLEHYDSYRYLLENPYSKRDGDKRHERKEDNEGEESGDEKETLDIPFPTVSADARGVLQG